MFSICKYDRIIKEPRSQSSVINITAKMLGMITLCSYRCHYFPVAATHIAPKVITISVSLTVLSPCKDGQCIHEIDKLFWSIAYMQRWWYQVPFPIITNVAYTRWQKESLINKTIYYLKFRNAYFPSPRRHMLSLLLSLCLFLSILLTNNYI